MTAVVAKNKVVSLIYVVRNQKGEIFEYRDAALKSSFSRVLRGLSRGGITLICKAEESNRGATGCHLIATIRRSPHPPVLGTDSTLTCTLSTFT